MIRPESEMKDSGIEGINSIPENWLIKRIKYLFCERNEKVINASSTELLSVSEYYGVAPRKEKISQAKILVRAESLEGYKRCEKNDLVSNIMLAWKGAMGISNYRGVVSPSYCVYTPLENLYPRYYHYLFRTDIYKEIFKQHSTGIIASRLRLYTEQFFSLEALVPPLSEQQAIADYLDEKCSKIDDIIAEANASIEEYKELKLSVLTTATTKGISDAIEYKISGSRWVNKIPSNWSKIKIHYIIDMPVIDGPHVSPELVGEGVDYISANAIVDGKIDFNKRRGFITREYSNECRKRYSPKKNDILVVKLGASTGKMAMVGEFTDFDIWVPLAVVRCKQEVNAKYIYYSMSSKYFKDEIKDGWTFGTQETLGVKTLESLYIFLPSRDEQDEIVSYLDEQLPKYDSLIAEKESLIKDLESYKKSLIYEVVTGKRRVV